MTKTVVIEGEYIVEEEKLLSRYGFFPIYVDENALISLLEGIRGEVAVIANKKKKDLPPHVKVFEGVDQLLRNEIHEIKGKEVEISLSSFGFSYGLPEDASFIFDARSLPNPSQNIFENNSGMDSKISDYLFQHEESSSFVEALYQLILSLSKKSGKSKFKFAVGCVAGRQRSVACVERLFSKLSDVKYIKAFKHHRDI